MAPKSANAHEAQVSPPTQVQHPKNPFISNLAKLLFDICYIALDGAHLLGVVLASEGGLAGGDLCSDPGDVQLQVVPHLVLLAVVGLARVEEDHTLEMKI